MKTSPICVEGKNCCSISRATRVALLVDGEAYFSALTSTLERAQRSVFIAGWQLDSRFRLNPRNSASLCFGDFLHDLVRRNRKLRIYVLLWDFAMIYAAIARSFRFIAIPGAVTEGSIFASTAAIPWVRRITRRSSSSMMPSRFPAGWI
jgi:phosphatidylserine/phosphatidylglycerophosphate/cardiolipin synthase-like enzyme